MSALSDKPRAKRRETKCRKCGLRYDADEFRHSDAECRDMLRWQLAQALDVKLRELGDSWRRGVQAAVERLRAYGSPQPLPLLIEDAALDIESHMLPKEMHR